MVDKILEERGNRYGSFESNARIAQAMKEFMRDAPSWNDLQPHQKEALEMIIHKVSRILNGDVTYDDNWVDLIGYAQVSLDLLQATNKAREEAGLFHVVEGRDLLNLKTMRKRV